MTIQISASNPVYTVPGGATVSASDGSPLFELAQTSGPDDVSVTLDNYGALNDSGPGDVTAIDDTNGGNALAVFNNYGSLTVDGVTQAIGSLASVQNNGSISVTATGPNGAAYGVAPVQYFANDGTLDVVSAAGAFGVYWLFDYTQIANSANATIDVHSTAFQGPTAAGIDIEAGYINNAGKISVTGGSAVYGIIVGYDDLGGSQSQIVNTGAVTVTDAGDGVFSRSWGIVIDGDALAALRPASLVNSGSITAEFAIQTTVPVDIQNSGSVNGEVDLAGGSTLANTGVISGPLRAAGPVSIDSRGGSIDGPIYLGAGTANVHTPETIYLGNGDNQVNISDGAGDVTIVGGPGTTTVNLGFASATAGIVKHADGSWTMTNLEAGATTLVNVQTVEFSDGTFQLSTFVPPAHVPNDFDGDGHSDVLFAETNGTVGEWQINGPAIEGGGTIGAPGGTWTAVGAGDFSGSGFAGILFHDAAGDLAIWEMNGPVVVGGGDIGNPGGAWAVKGVADFNGDGQADILFQDATGNLAIWEMSGTQIIGGGDIGNPGGTWQAKGVGDFNGDGHPDILFQDASGDVAIWEMNGAQIIGGGVIGNPGGTWLAKGVGDFNGDGKADILFENDSGDYAIWEMNGTAIVGGGDIGNPGGTWAFAGVGEYFGTPNAAIHNDFADILFQDASGNVADWLMNGTSIVGGGLIGDAGPAWHVVV